VQKLIAAITLSLLLALHPCTKLQRVDVLYVKPQDRKLHSFPPSNPGLVETTAWFKNVPCPAAFFPNVLHSEHK
jgi:hypothetical protein